MSAKPTVSQLAEQVASQGALLEQIAAALTAPDTEPKKKASGKSGKRQQTAAKSRRVSIPSREARSPEPVPVPGRDPQGFAYRAYPDSKYKGYVMFELLKDDGSVRKHVRLHNSVLRDLVEHGSDVVSFDWPNT